MKIDLSLKDAILLADWLGDIVFREESEQLRSSEKAQRGYTIARKVIRQIKKVEGSDGSL